MLNIKKKHFRELISRKYLEWAGTLPKFRGGFISNLQDIREFQSKQSAREFEGRKKPENASIILDEIRLVYVFQLEEFQLIRSILNKIFPDNNKIKEIINELKNEETLISRCEWRHIGFIAKSHPSIRTRVVESLPDYASIIKVLYQRITPSVASLSFAFSLDKRFSDELNIAQNKKYLLPVILERFNPFSGSTRGYKIEYRSIAKDVIRGKIDKLELLFNEWLDRNIRSKEFTGLSKAKIEYYRLEGNPLEEEELVQWLKDYRGWLGDYGISSYENSYYINKHQHYCESFYQNTDLPVFILTSLEVQNSNQNEKDYLLDETLNSLSIVASLASMLNSTEKLLEIYRNSSFQLIAKHETKILNYATSVASLKRLSAVLKRLHYEIKEYRDSITIFLAGTEDLKNDSQSLNDSIIEGAVTQIESMLKTYVIVDDAITRYLEIQNIYAIYRLQKYMFYLTVIILVATLASVLTGWKSLAEFYSAYIKL